MSDQQPAHLEKHDTTTTRASRTSDDARLHANIGYLLLAIGVAIVAASLPLNAESNRQQAGPQANSEAQTKAPQPNTLTHPSDDRTMMGYGTTPITDDDVKDPSLGNKSMLGTEQDQQSAADDEKR